MGFCSRHLRWLFSCNLLPLWELRARRVLCWLLSHSEARLRTSRWSFGAVGAAVGRNVSWFSGVLLLMVAAASAGPARAQDVTIRVGHFPNITHVQALVARALEQQGHGWFAPRLGPGVKIEWYSYNAGPSAMEAIFANSLDLTYVGPTPALNAYVRSRGEEIRIVAGAVAGGSALVVQPDSGLTKAGRFPRQADRDPATRQHPGCRRPGLAGCRRSEHHADGRRRQGDPDREPGPDSVVPEQADRCGLDRRALGVPPRTGGRRQGSHRGPGFRDDRAGRKRRISAQASRSRRSLRRGSPRADRLDQGQSRAGAKPCPPRDQCGDPHQHAGGSRCPRLGPDEADRGRLAARISIMACRRTKSRLSSQRSRACPASSRCPDSIPARCLRSSWSKHVSKRLRDETRRWFSALEDVSLEVAAGDFVCLVGPSGCGKSTLLDIMAGLTTPDAGRVAADGEPVAGPGRQRLVMFQESALFPWLDVFGNVMFGLKLKPGLTREERRKRALDHLKMVGLESFAHANIHELSGGMKQRVGAGARAGAGPRVLLMDEPFAALDAMTRDQLYGDIQRIWQTDRQDHRLRHAQRARGSLPRRPRPADVAATRRMSSMNSTFRCRARAISTMSRWPRSPVRSPPP